MTLLLIYLAVQAIGHFAALVVVIQELSTLEDL